MNAVLEAALAEKQRIASARSAKLARASELDAGEREAAERLAEVEAQLLALEGDALAEGREADPCKVAALEAAGKGAARKVRAAKAGAERLRAEVTAMDDEAAAADREVTNAALTAVQTIRDDASEGVRNGLAAIAPHLAALLASDEIRTGLVGREFTFDSTLHSPAELWSGLVAAKKLLDNLPTQFLPSPGFKAETEANGRSAASQTLAKLKTGGGR